MAEWASKVKGWKNAYVLMDTTIAFDATWVHFFKRRWAELAGAGGLAGEDTFGGEDPQIASQITRIKALPAKPDFIVLCSFPPGGVSALRQLRAAGITGYCVIEAWSRAVERAGKLDTDAVRGELQKFKDEPLLAGPTIITEDVHINMQRDLLLMSAENGKQGNIVQVVRAEAMPK